MGLFFLKQFLCKSFKTQPECKIRYKLISCCVSDQFQFEMVVLKVLREFAAGTSIHGFKFLESPKSSSRTKIIWGMAIVVALSYASWEMRNSAISKYYCVFRTMKKKLLISITYRKVASSSMSQLVAHFQIFRGLMKGCLCIMTFDQKDPKLNSRQVYCLRLYGR